MSEKVVFPLRMTAEFREFLEGCAQQRQLSLNAFLVSTLGQVLHYSPAVVPRSARVEGPASVSSKGADIRARAEKEPAHNAPCSCGSGKKFKRCCGRTD